MLLVWLLFVDAVQLEISLNNQTAIIGENLNAIIANSGLEKNGIISIAAKSGDFDASCIETLTELTKIETFVLEEGTSFSPGSAT